MSSTGNVVLSDGFRAQALETLFQINRTATRHKQLSDELESIVQSAAKFVGVDLKLYVLDIQTLEFIKRPEPPAQPEAQAATEPTPVEVREEPKA